jgi:hypothetical protein
MFWFYIQEWEKNAPHSGAFQNNQTSARQSIAVTDLNAMAKSFAMPLFLLLPFSFLFIFLSCSSAALLYVWQAALPVCPGHPGHHRPHGRPFHCMLFNGQGC